jgi:signal transduction histidine kinase
VSVRGIGDGYAFQRLLWLFLGTVIAPTILLALYGVSAIRNQNAWVTQQARQSQELRLQDAARQLFSDIGHVDGRVRARVEQCLAHADKPCAPEEDRVASLWLWPAGEAPPAALQAVGVPIVNGKDTLWFNPSDGADPIGTYLTQGVQVAWQVDIAAFQELLNGWVASRFPGDLRIQLTGAAAPGPLTPLAEMREAWQEPEVDLLLQRPLNSWRLVIDRGNASTLAVVGRTAWVSPVALVLLVGLVMVGAAITLGAAARGIRLSQLQTDFVSNVSHELRTPLTSIRMFVETLQSGRLHNDPAKVEECLHLLAVETDRLSRMIERVLNWARMEAGRRVYEFENVDAEMLVGQALSALRSQHLMTDDVEISVTIPANTPQLRVDSDAIVEALLNLLQNAVKYTPAPRNIEVEASTRGRQVGLAVVDNGPGIAVDDRVRVFEKFYQANTLLSSSTLSGVERGSGLGLSIVRAVVRGHGGRVQLDSELGNGSRFTLWLPAIDPR